MSCTINLEGLHRAEAMLAGIPGAFPKAMARALNDSARKGRTNISKAIRQKYNVSAAKIKSGVSLRGGGLQRSLIVKGFPLSLLEFKPKATKKKGITVTIKKGSRKTLAKSFFAGFKTTGLGVYHRLTRKRFPIKKEYTVSVAQMASEPHVSEQVKTVCAETFENRLQHYIERALGGNA